jgi:hypothetical protein
MYVDAYFDKPLDRTRLLATVAELLAAASGAPTAAPAAAPDAAPREAPDGGASSET